MKKRSTYGFTLIEVIVVLAILAIMAAMAIPTMNGFIEEAKDNQYIAEARAMYTATQTVITKYQVQNLMGDFYEHEYSEQIEELAGNFDGGKLIYCTVDKDDQTKVNGIIYRKKVGKGANAKNLLYVLPVGGTVKVYLGVLHTDGYPKDFTKMAYEAGFIDCKHEPTDKDKPCQCNYWWPTSFFDPL